MSYICIIPTLFNMLELITVLLNEICKCCGLNVCLQNSYVEILTLKGISMWALRKVIKL